MRKTETGPSADPFSSWPQEKWWQQPAVVFSSYLSCALIVFLNCARVCVLFSVLAAFATAT